MFIMGFLAASAYPSQLRGKGSGKGHWNAGKGSAKGAKGAGLGTGMAWSASSSQEMGPQTLPPLPPLPGSTSALPGGDVASWPAYRADNAPAPGISMLYFFSSLFLKSFRVSA